MSKAGIWSIAAIAVCTFLYLVYLAVAFEPPRGTTTVILPTPAAEIEVIEPRPVPTRITPSTPAAAASVEVEPMVVDVVEVKEPVAEAAVDLPRLNDSDSFLVEKISELPSGTSLLSYLVDEQLVRRAVVLVENISRGQYPQTALPYKPIVEEMQVSSDDGRLFTMEAVSYTRFDAAVAAFVALDTEQTVGLYRLLSPLLQQAYAEIGFRDAEFEQALIKAIDAVLSAPEIEGPFQLVKPSVMYLYADTRLEELANMNKQLIRLGPENSARLKAKLREFKQAL
ncbi:DUF3014 domain-containing protein [Gammaproteobacteria bacterium]|nr:DUF3014 domain-containing protein [Gammaproteobacteria bacterium]MDC1422956.1 DUF3014 domain-containing protein [Gammaproteobacteria bacterium]MDC1511979.1 DUF3014 domain-containing protein [Gammaproteobacteria bacterium]